MRDRECREDVLELSVLSCREDSELESLLLDRLCFCFGIGDTCGTCEAGGVLGG